MRCFLFNFFYPHSHLAHSLQFHNCKHVHVKETGEKSYADADVHVCSLSPDLVENCSEFLTFWVVCQRKILINQEVNNSYHRYNIGHLHMGALQTYIRSGGCLVVAAGLTSLSYSPLTILCTSQNFQTYTLQWLGVHLQTRLQNPPRSLQPYFKVARSLRERVLCDKC